MKSTFVCNDIHCGKCAGRVKTALTAQPGVRQVEVDVPAKRVDVDYDSATVSHDMLVAAMAAAGYEAQ